MEGHRLLTEGRRRPTSCPALAYLRVPAGLVKNNIRTNKIAGNIPSLPKLSRPGRRLKGRSPQHSIVAIHVEDVTIDCVRGTVVAVVAGLALRIIRSLSFGPPVGRVLLKLCGCGSSRDGQEKTRVRVDIAGTVANVTIEI